MKQIEIQDHSCDICVVGGGLAGCMAAIRAAENIAPGKVVRDLSF